ncbi:hypothetical protein K457DRAFT_20118 [Linnemannia elongata AG-77]|uniref:Ion transport domain-containing protein n=1 Tax=Linnemannia elongata AG-77 TaxID=1314771 RepID=A0A197JUA9_9FUNG|nr:hypothetical protein K457DRAFT_20118 [Linnemannia elongata AG-77]
MVSRSDSSVADLSISIPIEDDDFEVNQGDIRDHFESEIRVDIEKNQGSIAEMASDIQDEDEEIPTDGELLICPRYPGESTIGYKGRKETDFDSVIETPPMECQDGVNDASPRAAFMTMGLFVDSGFYYAIWRISMPRIKREGACIDAENTVDYEDGTRMEFRARLRNSEIEKYVADDQTVQIAINEKIWVESNSAVAASLRLTLPSSTGTKNSSNAKAQDIGQGSKSDDQQPMKIEIDVSQGKISELSSSIVGETTNIRVKSPADGSDSGFVYSCELRPCDLVDSSVFLMKVASSVNVPDVLVPPCSFEFDESTLISTDISLDRSMAATLSVVEQTLHLYLWSLALVDNTKSAWDPVASTVITLDEGFDIGSRKLSIALSSDGRLLSVYEKTGDEYFEPKKGSVNFAVQFFTFELKKSSRSEKLVPVEYGPGSPLWTFVGLAKFQHRTPHSILSSEAREHVLVTDNGRSMDVFDVSHGFALIHTISLVPLGTRSKWTFECPIKTLQDTTFAWNGIDGEVSLWNWRTGRCIGRFPAANQVVISPDELYLATVLEDDSINIYSVASGLLLRSTDSQMQHVIALAFGFDGDIHLLGTSEFDEEWLIHSLDASNLKKSFDSALSFASFDQKFIGLGQCQVGGNKITRAVFQGEEWIEFTNLTTLNNSTPSVCELRCKDRWQYDGEEEDFWIDVEQDCTFKVGLDSQGTISRVLRESRSSLGKTAELWQLPTSEESSCKFLAVDTADRFFQGGNLCLHGSIHWTESGVVDEDHHFNVLRASFLGDQDTATLIRTIPDFVRKFGSYPPTYKSAIIDLTLQHISKTFKNPKRQWFATGTETSVMWFLVTQSVRWGSDLFLRAVLESPSIDHWVPRENEFSADPEQDLIAYLIKEYKVSMVKMLIDYCLARAHSNSPRFLDMLMISVPHIQSKHPEMALEISRRAVFIMEHTREHVLHHSVHNRIQWRWKFWTPVKSNLHELMDQHPVFHLFNQLPIKKIGERSNRQEEEKEEALPDPKEIYKKDGRINANFYVVPFSLIWTIEAKDDLGKVSTADPIEQQTRVHWFFKVLRMIWHFVYPFDTVHVQSAYSDLEAFDNPAIFALMTYKWTRFTSYFWCIRQLFQVSYEFLVLGVTFIQLYGDEDQREGLLGGYIAILVLGYMLLHLEFQQMRGGVRRYFSSPYNWVDLSAYAIPMVSSCVLIAGDLENVYALRALSFSVVLVYMHCVFELRVFRNVCKVVTIVVNILLQIPAFFIILAIFILSFAHSINHLTEVNFRASDCQPDAEDATEPSICNAQRSEFPKNYFQSVSATYFFMTGNYGPVETSLTDGHWTSQLMIGFFFFLTAVLMMNVVIALMNGVYSQAVIAGEQVWLKNRLELVTSAENLTYFLPNFRDRFDYFPKYIYYTATDKQVADYQEKYGFDKNPLQFDFMPKKPIDPTITNATVDTIRELRKTVVEMKEQMAKDNKRHEEELQRQLALEKAEHQAALEKLMQANDDKMTALVSANNLQTAAMMDKIMAQLVASKEG